MDLTRELKIEKSTGRDFPAGAVVKTPYSHCRAWVWSLVRKVRSHMPHNVAKKERERNLQLYLSTTVSLCGCSIVHLCLTLYDPMDCSPPGSSVEFYRQEYWVGLHFLLQGIFPTQGLKLHLLSLLLWQVDSLPTVPSGKPHQLQHSVITSRSDRQNISNIEDLNSIT